MNPRGRPWRAHELQAFAAPPALLTEPYEQPVPAVYPDQLRGRPWRAHEMQAFGGPLIAATPTVLQPLQPVLPSPQNLRGRPRRAHAFQAFASPGHFVTPVAPAIAGTGPAAAAALVLSLEPGTKVTYSWSTDVTTSYSGKEQRVSLTAQPHRRVEGNAFLLDASDRDVKGALQRAASTGAPFLLALPFEELTIAADSPGSTVTVASTAIADWAVPGQRVVIIGADGSTAYGIVQATTATEIELVLTNALGAFTFGALAGIGAAGGRIMPLVQVVLEPTQGFARYPVTVDLWTLRGRAVVYGFGGVDSMGLGTAITTMTQGVPVPVAELVDADVLIWDRTNGINGTAAETMIGRTELVDLGGVPFSLGGAPVPDWGRSIRFTSSDPDDWQWLKAFVHHVRGRQRAFLLSTNRPDLAFDSIAGGALKVKSASVTGGGDYVSWFASEAHRRLAITVDGAVQYATVTALVDNGDGTLSLTLDNPVTGDVTQISFLEQVRLESDDVEVAWDGGAFEVELGVVTAQEFVSVPLRLMFDEVIDQSFASGAPFTVELSATLGQTTLIHLGGAGKNITGLAAIGGNVDGMVVCMANVNVDSVAYTMVGESVDSAPENRFRFQGLGSNGGVRAAQWVRYDGALQRWVHILNS